MSRKPKNFTVALAIPSQLVLDTLDILHGGGSYTGAWVKHFRIHRTTLENMPITYTRKEDEEGEFKGKKRIGRRDIAQGIAAMAKANPYQFGLFIQGEGDATTADVFLQFVVLGEELYA